jgi:cell wall-associated NlpC family hydrolase
MTDVTPQPGDFGLCRISGPVGVLIRVGQWLAGSGFADYEHAFTYTGDGMIVEAAPGGALETSLAEYADRPIAWSTGHIALTDQQRQAIVAAARGYIGVGYSFADYLSLALARFHLRLPFVKRYVASTGHMICSQLVDQCYQDAGVHLFADDRWPGDVVPADLGGLIR